MTKDTEATNTYQPYFDFGSNLDPDGTQTATLKELLDELNYENNFTSKGKDATGSPAAGVKLNETSLEPTLEFIRAALGQDIQGTTTPIPLSTLKTIKLLYTRNDASDTHLFRRLARPDGNSATMEHWDKRNTPRNERTIRLASEMMTTIRRELSTTKGWQIDTSLLTTPKLLECIVAENFEILEPLYERHAGDDSALSQSFRQMAKVAASYTPGNTPHAAVPTPLHELLYIYLRTLPFFHFVGEYERHIRAEEVLDLAVSPVLDELEEFCNALDPVDDHHVHATTPVTSIAQFPAFLAQHALKLSKLIHQATGIKSERRDLLGIQDEAQKVLHAYVFHQWHRTDPDVINLTVTDCVAALATICIQKKEKTPYAPHWVGQDSGEQPPSRLLSHLDNTRSIEDLYEEDYIPQGAMLILYHRFCMMYSKISGQHQSRQLAWMDFQLARLATYAQCFRPNDINQMDSAVADYHHFCMKGAFETLNSITMETA